MKYYRIAKPQDVFREPKQYFNNFDQAMAYRHYENSMLMIYDEQKNLIKARDIREQIVEHQAQTKEAWNELKAKVENKELTWSNASIKLNKFRQRKLKSILQRIINE